MRGSCTTQRSSIRPVSGRLFERKLFMDIKKLDLPFSICKGNGISPADLTGEFCFYAKTDEEVSLVCPSKFVPAHVDQRDDGWRAFRIEGTLDFSLVGILARISTLLAQHHIGIFAISTYNTDYFFVKEENFSPAGTLLEEAGYRIC